MKRRKKNTHLPTCVHFKHGRYYHVVNNIWHPLSRNLSEALNEYVRRIEPGGGLDELIDRTLEVATVKESTLKQYETAAKKIKKAFAEFDPPQVKPMHIAQFLDHHRNTPNMANRMRTVLKLGFSNGLRWGMNEINPVIGIDPFPEQERDRYITDEELLMIIEKGSPPYLPLMVALDYLAGQRVMDIAHMKRSQIASDRLHFKQEKTGNKVEVERNDAIDEILDAAMALNRVASIYLFHQGNGKPYSYRAVRDAFSRTCKRCGIEDAQFRDIRAKSATDADEGGINATLLLGHTDPRTTKRYLRKKRPIKAQGPDSIRQLIDTN